MLCHYFRLKVCFLTGIFWWKSMCGCSRACCTSTVCSRGLQGRWRRSNYLSCKCTETYSRHLCFLNFALINTHINNLSRNNWGRFTVATDLWRRTAEVVMLWRHPLHSSHSIPKQLLAPLLQLVFGNRGQQTYRSRVSRCGAVTPRLAVWGFSRSPFTSVSRLKHF